MLSRPHLILAVCGTIWSKLWWTFNLGVVKSPLNFSQISHQSTDWWEKVHLTQLLKVTKVKLKFKRPPLARNQTQLWTCGVMPNQIESRSRWAWPPSCRALAASRRSSRTCTPGSPTTWTGSAKTPASTSCPDRNNECPSLFKFGNKIQNYLYRERNSFQWLSSMQIANEKANRQNLVIIRCYDY